MLWMITDFSRTSDAGSALESIADAFKNGAGKVSLRNLSFFSKEIIHEMKNSLDDMFPRKEIFIHDPDDKDINKFKHFHFPSNRLEDAIRTRKENPEFCIAVSTHSRKEYENAFNNGIDYAFLSPVFRPLSKPEDSRELVPPVKMKNLYLLGGIDRMKALWLIEKGFTNIAGISLFYGEGSAGILKELLQTIKEKEYGIHDSN